MPAQLPRQLPAPHPCAPAYVVTRSGDVTRTGDPVRRRRCRHIPSGKDDRWAPPLPVTKEVLVVPLTRLNGGTLHLNADLIATVEEHHDTVVTLVDGSRLVVAETAAQVVDEVVRFHATVRATGKRLFLDGAGQVTLPAAEVPAPAPGDALVLPLRPGGGS